MLASTTLDHDVKLISIVYNRLFEKVRETGLFLGPLYPANQRNIVSLGLDRMSKLQRFLFPP